MGRFGGILKNVFGGIVQGIGEGTVGQGGIMRGIAENIQAERTGMSQPTYGATRAAPGRQLDFSQALDNPPPDPIPDPYLGPNNFVNMGNDVWADGGDIPMVTPITHTRPETPFNPNAGPRPRLDDPILTDDFYDGLGPDDDSDLNIGLNPANPLAGPVAPTVPMPVGNTMQGQTSVWPGETMGPTRPSWIAGGGGGGGGYSGGGGGCSCRPKRSCAEKCAYDEQMKEQCKPCRSYFRRTKKYIYPKRKKYTRRSYPRKRTYRRRKSPKKTSSYNTRKAGFEAGYWAGLRSGQMGPIR